ncbi:MAG: CPBP family intramembrane metalloprotease [Planctomycetales bacterium]|nr:CPBP family intramembrane metalloprotease [Planctomycetales bacterium]
MVTHVTNPPLIQPPTALLPRLVVAEAALGLVGVILARLAGIELAPDIAALHRSLVTGIVATGPLLVALAALATSRLKPVARLRDAAIGLFGDFVVDAPQPALALLSLAAGVGEETLFRGALQPWAVAAWGSGWGWAVVSLAFGALHAASVSYVAMATLMGAYLGWLSSTHGLAAAIVAHALYDWAALATLKRLARRRRRGSGGTRTEA